jgi:hypothetical protein
LCLPISFYPSPKLPSSLLSFSSTFIIVIPDCLISRRPKKTCL